MAGFNDFLGGIQANPLFLAGMMGYGAASRGDAYAPAMAQGFGLGQAGMRTGLARDQMDMAQEAHRQNMDYKTLQMEQLQLSMERARRQREAMQKYLASPSGQQMTAGLGLTGAPPALVSQMVPELMKAQIQAGKPPTLERNIQALMARGYPQEKAVLAALGMGGTHVNFPGQPSPGEVALAEHDVGVVRQGREDARAARQSLMQGQLALDSFEEIFRRGGSTGAWEPFQLFVGRYLGLGDTEAIPYQQLFTAQMGDRVRDRIAQTKGAISDREMAYFKEIEPSIGQDPFANYAMLRYAQEGAQLQIDKARAQEAWWRARGNLQGFEDAWAEQNKEVLPSLSELREDYQRMRQRASPVPATPPVGAAPDLSTLPMPSDADLMTLPEADKDLLRRAGVPLP